LFGRRLYVSVIKDNRAATAASSPLLMVGRSEIGRNAFRIV
jgi:hypothetical protein